MPENTRLGNWRLSLFLLFIYFQETIVIKQHFHWKKQDWFLPQFDTLIPIIVGIMFQDLTVLHSSIATREKQGKMKI